MIGREWLHNLAHFLGWNLGTVVAATDHGHDLVWVAYRCAKCGKVSGKCIARTHLRPPADGEFS